MQRRRRGYGWRFIISGWALLAVTACEEAPDPPAESPEPQPTAGAQQSPAQVTGQATDQARLDLNNATEEEFLTIPGVGDQMVHEFFEYRPYVSIRQFRREIGKYVDEEQVAAYEEYVYVPVDPDESDAATLQQLPGVDSIVAAELVAGRPYESNDAFLEALSAHIGEDELARARTYLTSG